MNIAIVGSRTFNNYEKVKETFFNIPEIKDNVEDKSIIIVSGGAKGADKLGEKLADEFGYKKIIHYPDWDKFGKRAGFIRNELIVEDADIVIAFWDGVSRGTKSTINISKNKNKKLYIQTI